jgi:hypothetical protein
MSDELDESAELGAVDSDYAPPCEDGRTGPPNDWPRSSWFDFRSREWWYRFDAGWRLDPPPVRPLGYRNGEYFFITEVGELRILSSSALHRSGGMSDLFGGDWQWPLRHYPATDRQGNPAGRPNVAACMARLIWVCQHTRYFDHDIHFCGVGTWRGPDGTPLVHAGDRIFYAGQVLRPGTLLDNTLYKVGGERTPPQYVMERGSAFRWEPAPLATFHAMAAHLDEWPWRDSEARDLFIGGLLCDMLGDALKWKSHRFVRAPAGSGKSTLLEFMRALLGASAHDIVRDYTKSFLEQNFSHTSCALLMDEAEGDKDSVMRVLCNLILLLSDHGAIGGRGSSSGQARTIDLHSSVTMVATLTDTWKRTIRSRVTLLELDGFEGRVDRPIATAETMAAMLERAAAASPGMRARALAKFDLFRANLALVRPKIMELGGSPRDADQLGHLIAGWATFTSDEVLTEDELGRLERFKPYIMTLSEEEEGADDPSNLLNTLFGSLMPGMFKGSHQLTVGEAIALARQLDGGDAMREALKRIGLRLLRLKSQVTGRLEEWPEAWLAVANQFTSLEDLLADYPDYKAPKRGQILAGLRRTVDGVLHQAKSSGKTLKFNGVTQRAWLVPPVFLPSVDDDKDDDGDDDS